MRHRHEPADHAPTPERNPPHHLGHDRSDRGSLNRTALSATVHCLTGCAIGEALGMVIGTTFHLGNWTTVGLAIVLAFVFGYSLTMVPLLRSGLGLSTALALAFASDTASIALMEVVDNIIMLYIPGAMEAGPGSPLFWGSLLVSLVIAGVVAFPLNRWLIGRGRGHAVVHAYHHRRDADVTPGRARSPR
jgi:Domain of unknown function (DUF4396)